MDNPSLNLTTGEEVLLSYDDDTTTESLGAIEALSIVLSLIVLTIFFEKMKHEAEHRAGRALRPVVEALFGELTVLGFLSMVTFIMERMGVFLSLSRAISDRLGGGDEADEREEDEVFELVETIHFAMFFVMVVFLVQVLFEVHHGLQDQEEWCQWDRACHDKAYVKSLVRKFAEYDKEYDAVSSMPGLRGMIRRSWRFLMPYLRFLPFLRDEGRENLEDKMEFCSLRWEFLQERGCDPPFAPAGEAGGSPKTIGDHFNFGRYLTFAYAKKMTAVVEIDVTTWLFYAGGTVCYFLLYDALGFSIQELAWAWVLIGWIFHVLSINFEKYLLGIRDRFLAPKFVPKPRLRVMSSTALSSLGDDSDNIGTEREPLRKLDKGLPMWCYIDINERDRKRGKLSKAVFGPTPQNRQHALYLFGSNGPTFHILCLRIMLVFSCIYSAQLVTLFVPMMIQDDSTSTLVIFIYCSLAFAPALAFIFNKKRLIATMVEVGSIGPFVLPQAIAESEKEEKTSMAVRILVIYFNLARMTKHFLANPSTFELPPSKVHFTEVLPVEEIADLVRIFTLFIDLDGDGFLSGVECQSILSTLGITITESEANDFVRAIMKLMESAESLRKNPRRETIQDMVNSAKSLNVEPMVIRDDEVALSVYALLQLHVNQRGKGVAKKDIMECAQFWFGLFDDDNSGDITVLEFKQQLDKMAIGISHEEADELIQELDMDGNGVLCEKEFEELIERFYPIESQQS